MSVSLISRTEAAKFLGIKTQTLAVWASTKRYPIPYVKVGRRAMYRRTDLEQFVQINLKGGHDD